MATLNLNRILNKEMHEKLAKIALGQSTYTASDYPNLGVDSVGFNINNATFAEMCKLEKDNDLLIITIQESGNKYLTFNSSSPKYINIWEPYIISHIKNPSYIAGRDDWEVGISNSEPAVVADMEDDDNIINNCDVSWTCADSEISNITSVTINSNLEIKEKNISIDANNTITLGVTCKSGREVDKITYKVNGKGKSLNFENSLEVKENWRNLVITITTKATQQTEE